MIVSPSCSMPTATATVPENSREAYLLQREALKPRDQLEEGVTHSLRILGAPAKVFASIADMRFPSKTLEGKDGGRGRE